MILQGIGVFDEDFLFSGSNYQAIHSEKSMYVYPGSLYSLVVMSFTIFSVCFLSLFKRFTTSFGTVATTSSVFLTFFDPLEGWININHPQNPWGRLTMNPSTMFL